MALEREKNKLVLEKCQSILTSLLKDEDNKYCVDCDAKSPRWASWNIGIFLCIRCAGIHRNLGVHISKVKSVNLDTWTPQQVACIQQMGNSRARAVYEANLEDNFRRPQKDSSLEHFIRAKYEAKKYIAREWVPPALPNPTWDLEIEKQLKKKREKKSSVSGSIEFPAPVKNSASKSGGGISPKPLPKAPGGRNASSSPNQTKRNSSSGSSQKDSSAEKENSSGTIDLLGLDAPPVTTATNGVAEGEGDVFGDFLTAPTTIGTTPPGTTLEATKNSSNSSTTATQNDESSFFNQKLPDLSGSEKLSKDSILALYHQTPAHAQTPPQTHQPVYGGGGMFMGGTSLAMGTAPPQHNLAHPPQVPQQQNMMLFQQASTGGSVGTGGIQPTMYSPQGMTMMGGTMYPSMAGAMPPGVPGGVQLSAANPFAQMQAQMAGMTFGGMVGSQTQQQHQQMTAPNPLLKSGMGLSNHHGPHQSTTTLATNLWQ